MNENNMTNELPPVLNSAMQGYRYTGCMMSVAAEGSGLPDVLLPNAEVQADPNHAYVKRLVAKGLLKSIVKLVCIPTSLEVDNTTVLSAGVYNLTLQVNSSQAVTYSIDTTNVPAAPTPANLLAIILQNNIQGVVVDGGGGSYWIAPNLNGQFWQDTNSTKMFSGINMGDVQENSLTILPSPVGTTNDLYPLLAKNNEASLSIQSCAVVIALAT